MQITVQVREVYGNKVFYPVGEKAELLAGIAGTKTLTIPVLSKIKQLGIEVEVQYQSLGDLMEAFS